MGSISKRTFLSHKKCLRLVSRNVAAIQDSLEDMSSRVSETKDRKEQIRIQWDYRARMAMVQAMLRYLHWFIKKAPWSF